MMAEQREHGTTLEECEAAGGARNPKSKRAGLKLIVHDFLLGVMVRPDGIEKKAQYKQREMEAEIRGYYKAQEHLREMIAMAGTDAIAELAEVRDPEGRQQRPVMIGNMRTWFG